MASKWPPVKNAGFTFRIFLFAQSDQKIKTTPTIAAGDFQVSTDGGAFANLATLPSESPAGSGMVLVTLSAAEMNGDEVAVRAIDAAGDEWYDWGWLIHTVGQTLDTVDANVDSILLDTDELQTNQGNWVTADVSALATAASITALNDLSAAEVNAEVVDVLRTDTIPDSYAADGAQPTIAQALMAIHQFLMDKEADGTTLNVRKPDGSTVAMTFTLDSATAPTSITRAT